MGNSESLSESVGRRRFLKVYLIDLELVAWSDFQFCAEIFLYGERVAFIVVGEILIQRVTGDIVLLERNGLTPRSCRMHISPSMTASSSMVIKSLPSF
jgi:hypothetical protein